MWVTFFVDQTSSNGITFTSYQVQGEPVKDLARDVTTDSLVELVLEGASMSREALLETGSASVALQLEELADFVLEPSRRCTVRQNSSVEVSSILNVIERQQRQMTHQTELLTNVLRLYGLQQNIVEPHNFEDSHSSPNYWLWFYEYACEKNGWVSDEQKIRNMRRYLGGIAKAWYEMQLLDEPRACWEHWKTSFLAVFHHNAVESWEAALRYTFERGSLLKYFLEKRRLLYEAEPKLSPQVTVALIIQGLCLDIRSQIQIRAPTTFQDLLHCLQYVLPGADLDAPDEEIVHLPSPSNGVKGSADERTDCKHNSGLHSTIAAPHSTDLRNFDVHEKTKNVYLYDTVHVVSNCLLHVPVKINDVEMKALVDSGASVSIINKDLVDVSHLHVGKTLRVQGYDGSVSSRNEWASVILECQGRRIRTEVLVLPDVTYEFLLSRPDMKRLRMNVYWNDKVLIENHTTANDEIESPAHARQLACEEDIQSQYPELVCIGNYPPAIKSHEVPFDLADKTVVQKRPYNMSREKKVWLKAELQAMLDAGVIRPSVSPFASPITIAPKEDGTFRLCTDYRALNHQTELIPYPMPRIDDIIDETGGCRWFSRLDLCKGFWQIPLTEETKKYTAFITPFDLYEYNRLPFGWKNSPAWFQKIMNETLKSYLGIFCNVYIDDIIVYSKTREEHKKHLSLVLNALSTACLKVNFKKSAFFQEKVVFLGRVFDGYTKSTKQESVDRISQLVKPYDVHSLRVFLGLAGHFRSFIKDYAIKTRCLTRLTQKGVPYQWDNDCENAYSDLVKLISSDPILCIPDFSLPFVLNTDASFYATGAVLYQKPSDLNRQTHHVVGYYSYTLKPAEVNYSTTEKEALAVLKAVQYFRTYLEGSKFTLFTDHQALTHLLGMTQPRGRIARWVNYLQQFDFVISHRPGPLLTDADAMSRLLVPNTLDSPMQVNHAKLWEGTEDMKFINGRYYVPPTMISKILHLYHDTPESGGHDGFWRTYNKLVKRFKWPGMKDDVRSYIRSCHLCQTNKVKFKQPTDIMITTEHSNVPFEVIHLDFAELKKKGEGVKKTQAFLLAIDECTRMVTARAGREDANSVMTLLKADCFKHTKVLVCDNGPAFRSTKLSKWAEDQGITIKFCSPYHPAANGLAERAIRDTKQYIKMYPNFQGGWKCCLEAAVRHHNRSSTSALGCSPLFAASGTVPVLPADIELGLLDRLTLSETKKTGKEQEVYKNRMKKNFDRRHSNNIPDIQPGDYVLVRKGIGSSNDKFYGPFQVIKTASQHGILKTIWYLGVSKQTECASISNVFKYYTRRCKQRSPGE